MTRVRQAFALITAVLVGLTVIAGTSAADSSAKSDPAVQTIVSIQFDDGRDELGVPAILKKHNMHGTFFVNTGIVGDGSGQTFTWKQLRKMQADGHEITGHTLTHRDLATLSPGEQAREICTDRNALIAHGLHAINFAYPFGSYTNKTKKIVKQCGYSSGRMAWGLWGSGCEMDADCPYAENPANISDIWAIKAGQAPIDLTTVQFLKEQVMSAEQHGGGWVQLFWHHICADDCDLYSYSPADLDTFLTWLEARQAQGTVVRTSQEVLNLPQLPVVQPPAPPAAPMGKNKLRNAGLNRVDTDGLPKCWERNGGDDWSAPKVGDGRAQKVTNFSYDSTAVLSQPEDQGECTTPFRAGQHLKASVTYRSNAHPRVGIWQRGPSGAWNLWRTGPALSTSKHWKTATLRLPVTPAGTKSVRVGLILSGLGSAAVDSFSLEYAGN